MPYFTSKYIPEKPYATQEIAERYRAIEKACTTPPTPEEELAERIYITENVIGDTEAAAAMRKELEEMKAQREAERRPYICNDLIRDSSVLWDEINAIRDKYSFYTIVFEGPDGKQGLKDCLGNVLVPAKYDGFGILYDPFLDPIKGIPAIRDGRYVVVSVDGSGTELTKKTYDLIILASEQDVHAPYLYRNNGLSAWGLMSRSGEELCECIVDDFCDQLNYAFYSSGGLWGYWNYFDGTFLPPIYDNIESEMEPGCLLMFTLDGVRGYVKYDGTFISQADFDNLPDEENLKMWQELIFDSNMDC